MHSKWDCTEVGGGNGLANDCSISITKTQEITKFSAKQSIRMHFCISPACADVLYDTSVPVVPSAFWDSDKQQILIASLHMEKDRFTSLMTCRHVNMLSTDYGFLHRNGNSIMMKCRGDPYSATSRLYGDPNWVHYLSINIGYMRMALSNERTVSWLAEAVHMWSGGAGYRIGSEIVVTKMWQLSRFSQLQCW